jgi:hypothetical protein
VKKVLVVALAVAVVAGLGFSAKKVSKNQAGDPPIGSVIKVSFVKPLGDPPIGS